MRIVLWIGLVALALGCGAEVPGDQSEIGSGKALFMRNGCAVCHGKTGRGDGQVAATLKPPPRDFRDLQAYKHGSGVEAIARTIERGVPGSTMPGYPHIAAADRKSIAAYIIYLQSDPKDKEE